MDEDHAKLRMPWIRDNVFEHPGGGLEGKFGVMTWAQKTEKASSVIDLHD
jgi:hypothetical protein